MFAYGGEFMYIMSVDLGKARTGIALSDNSESFAFDCLTGKIMFRQES